ncbi:MULTISPECIES: I78 family peptidase inhibitor [Paracoccaceae]|jgi:hypothetical protein|uniref:I78 family peptidase inhibitor n=1 Tax=Rhodobacterales TaxID=204455 RepID=UPI001D0A8978|nr:I78 family peptidase inhibitor [Boseongicola sp. H5]
MRFALVIVPFMALAACQEQGVGDDPESLGATDACGASGWQALIGEHRDVLAAMTFPAPMRVYGPDDAVTMDYSPERLNVIHDEDGIITRVECG